MPTPNLAVPAEDPSATRASPVDDAEVPQYYSQQLQTQAPLYQPSYLSYPNQACQGGGGGEGSVWRRISCACAVARSTSASPLALRSRTDLRWL